MMRSTYKIQSGGVLGTAFIVGQPYTNDALRGSTVLVTAAHVLSEMPSSNATIFLRIKEGDTFKKRPYDFPIRSNGTNLWTCHPKADVAVMRIVLPRDADIYEVFPPTTILADDKLLTDIQLHPGDEVRILGFPYGFEANDAGFPVLRSGKIASYPLTPTSKVQTFLLDFQVFRGNSGGPVYLLERRSLSDQDVSSISIFRILGLISQEATINESVSTLDENSVKRHQLGLGVVVQAQAIKEAIDLLPPP
jgi:S1-C subfamily serine protease